MDDLIDNLLQEGLFVNKQNYFYNKLKGCLSIDFNLDFSNKRPNFGIHYIQTKSLIYKPFSNDEIALMHYN